MGFINILSIFAEHPLMGGPEVAKAKQETAIDKAKQMASVLNRSKKLHSFRLMELFSLRLANEKSAFSTAENDLGGILSSFSPGNFLTAEPLTILAAIIHQ